ncbi:MAG: hypothetical protein Q7S89_00680 [bacterium]|nr:hypothetical protein [bacterium]
MVNVIHGAVGALLGQHLESSPLAFLVGFLSHFVLDSIPHGDRDSMLKWRHHGKIDSHWWVMGIDFILTVVFVAIAFSLDVFANPYAAAYGFVGAIIPDTLIGISELCQLLGVKSRIFRRFYALHFWFHNILLRRNIDFSVLKGLFFQGAVLIVVLVVTFWK